MNEVKTYEGFDKTESCWYFVSNASTFYLLPTIELMPSRSWFLIGVCWLNFRAGYERIQAFDPDSLPF